MATLFDLLGLLLGLYAAQAVFAGSVFIKHRAWGRSVLRDQEPGYFWLVIAIYAGLAVALVLVF